MSEGELESPEGSWMHSHRGREAALPSQLTTQDRAQEMNLTAPIPKVRDTVLS